MIRIIFEGIYIGILIWLDFNFNMVGPAFVAIYLFIGAFYIAAFGCYIHHLANQIIG